MSKPFVLGFDTSAAHCAAALLCDGELIAAKAEEMGRGQAERLFPLLAEVLASANVGWSDVHRLGVGIGPGNFTGIRISVSAARGLALSLGVPAIGVSNFEAIRFCQEGPHLPVVPAPRDHVYALRPGFDPALMPLQDANASGLPLRYPPPPVKLAEAIARIAAAAAAADFASPAPLYIKPADAAPSRDAPPVILNDT